MPRSERSLSTWCLCGAGTLLLLAVALRLAWLGDDACITLRTVENWARGLGPRWNTDERVQTYTHPLWMLVLAAGRAMTSEVYFTTVVTSLLVSGAAVLWLLLRAATPLAMAATFTLLLFTRAFGDYMTSGLETPLTFLLLVAFVAEAQGQRDPARRLLRLVLLASLAMCNRMDLALLCAPVVIAAMRDVSWRGRAIGAAIGALPFVAWIGFATIYYGSPFPVTAYAKAFGVGIAQGELIVQGLRYLLHSCTTDPLLPGVVLFGAGALSLRSSTRWFGVGALLYVGYVVKVGGDFMQGRFLLPPFVVVVAAGAESLRAASHRALVGCVVAAGITLFAGLPGWMRGPADDQPATVEQIEAQHGIVDERCMYYRELGLFSPTRTTPVFGAMEAVAFPEGRQKRWFLLNGAVGVAGFGAGQRGHLIDPLLCDPLVARLPARDPDNWRIGHVLRRIPEGYYESLATDQNRIVHEGLRRYYEDLRLATRAPLFDGERLAAVWRLATGAHRDDLRWFVAEQYRRPPRVEVPASRLAKPQLPGEYWFDLPHAQLIYEGGVAVTFDAPQQAKSLRVQLLGGMFVRYRVRFVRGGEVVGEGPVQQLPPPPVAPLRVAAGLLDHHVAVPTAAGAFDAVWIDFVETENSHLAVGPSGVGSLTIE